MRDKSVVSNKTPDKENNMDRFKFRVWNRKRGIMIGGAFSNYLLSPNGDLMRQFGFDVPQFLSEEELAELIRLQCTGLKDAEGTLIYEGDIVEQDDRNIGAPRIYKGEVYYCMDYTLGPYPGFAGWSPKGHFFLSPAMKVIGNIYENPELFEESK